MQRIGVSCGKLLIFWYLQTVLVVVMISWAGVDALAAVGNVGCVDWLVWFGLYYG